MYHIRNRRRLSIRITATALVVASASTCADGVETRDCGPSAVHLDSEGQPLTRDEKIARMDQALYESLMRFDECQTAASSAEGQDAGAEGAGSDAADAGAGASGQSDAAEGSRNAEAPETGEPASDGGSIESVAAEGIQGTEAPETGEPATEGGSIESVAAGGIQGTEASETGDTATVGTEQPQDASMGKVPEDIPEPDNDSVLEAQIRRAAMEETDPRLRAELWNEYRKYKGLPPKPLPEDDGGSTDAQKSE